MRIIFLLLFLVTFSLHSQTEYDYVGFLKLSDTSLITYKLKLINTNGVISGTSITDFGGKHETKSLLKGTYSKEDKLLSFNETTTVYSKSDIPFIDFCYVNFKPTKVNLKRDKKIIGAFFGKFSDGVKCIDGELMVSTEESYKKRLAKADKIIQKTKRVPDSIKKNIQIKKRMDSLGLNVLRRNEIINVFTKSSKVKLTIYDAGKIDNDIISLRLDNKTLINKKTISDKRQILNLKLDKKVSVLTLKAENVGEISTNTALILLEIDGKEIKALSNLRKNESTIIKIHKR